jgi:hypothetical protein
MKFSCRVFQLPDGRWRVRHEDDVAGPVEVTAGTKAEALEKMRGELQYRLELCPCSGESYQHLEIEIIEHTPGR